MTGKQFVAVLAAVALVLAAGGTYAVVHPDKAHGGPQPSQAITVVGSGTVTTTPDRADFSFGTHTQRKTAKAAAAATAVRMQKIIDALKKAGLDKRDIQTQQVSIYAQYTSGGTPDGYIASNAVLAKIRNIDRAGAVIDAAVGAGATNVYGPSLFRSDWQTLVRNALKAAVSDARGKAQAIAASSGTSVGRVVSVVEHGAIAPSTPAQASTTGGTTGAPAPSVPTPVQPGEQSIEATVSVTFASP